MLDGQRVRPGPAVVPAGAGFVGLYRSSPNLIMAGAMIAMALPIAVFIFGQRFFTKGIDLQRALK